MFVLYWEYHPQNGTAGDKTAPKYSFGLNRVLHKSSGVSWSKALHLGLSLNRKSHGGTDKTESICRVFDMRGGGRRGDKTAAICRVFVVCGQGNVHRTDRMYCMMVQR